MSGRTIPVRPDDTVFSPWGIIVSNIDIHPFFQEKTMNQKTEKDIVLYYLNNLLKRPWYGEFESHICDWFENNSRELIGKDVENLWEGRGWKRNKDNEQLLPRSCETIQQFLQTEKDKFEAENAQRRLNFTGQRSKRCRAIQSEQLIFTPEVSAIIKAFHLSSEYHDVLTMHIHAENIPLLHSMLHKRFNEQPEIEAQALDMSLRRYKKFFGPTSELLAKGLFNRHPRELSYPSSKLDDILYGQCRTPEAVKRIALGKPQKATLKPEHFEHIQEEYNWIKNLLANALAKKQSGVNILIYGKPGTGKTELAKTLCKEIGTSLYAISDDLSAERCGHGRRSNLAAALTLLQGDQNSALLMDEAEDVFDASSGMSLFFGTWMRKGDNDAKKSKLFFHKLLETNPVPVIWACNSIRGVDPAHLRRFSYTLNMESPDETVQTKIWNYSARKNKVKLPKEKIDKLVKTYDIAPAIIDTSLRTAALTGDPAAIEKTIEALQTAMHGRSAKKENLSEHEFSTELLNCDTDLEKLTQRIIALKGVNFSLCLYGVPGSGKSAYARHLAERLKMKVLHKRASDLFDPYIGVTEQKIAAAFAKAAKKKMLLVFDEADSFLCDRRYAQRNWEVAWVNEMLTQMESHPLPFVCTTNLMDDLDQASLRRFTFKVKYDFLSRKQTEAAFQHFFGMAPYGSLGGLTNLAPGDFAVVAKKARICGIDDPKELATMLRQEQDVKEVRKSVGFAAG